MSVNSSTHKLVLFDFDGTLADTAPDLAAAANKQRARQGLPPLPYESLRPYASHGARGLLKAALGLERGDPGYEQWRQRFLDDYEQDIAVHTRLFPGVDTLLEHLAADGFEWGIVTNKVEYLARPIIRHLGLEATCAVTVGGDTTPNPKPPYKHTFPRKFKETVVNYAKKFGLSEASKKFKITKKNIERWQLKGFERKKGAGRKTTNPAMEQDMLNWVENYIKKEKKLPKRKFIIAEARNFVSDSFKASKGWCDKFLKRNRVKFAKLIDEANEREE